MAFHKLVYKIFRRNDWTKLNVHVLVRVSEIIFAFKLNILKTIKEIVVFLYNKRKQNFIIYISSTAKRKNQAVDICPHTIPLVLLVLSETKRSRIQAVEIKYLRKAKGVKRRDKVGNDNIK